jgi:hypothetical protein
MLISESDICNLALSHLGNYTDLVSNIDTPTTDKEKTFALWYDITRQMLLRETIPNFAKKRVRVAKLVSTPTFGYAYEYEYPSNALRILGIGNAEDKENLFSFEDNKIQTDENYDDGLPIRYIDDVTDVTKFTPEFKILLSLELAKYTALPNGEDAQKLVAINSEIPKFKGMVCSINSQEDRPIRISTARFRSAREFGEPETQTKK